MTALKGHPDPGELSTFAPPCALLHYKKARKWPRNLPDRGAAFQRILCRSTLLTLSSAVERRIYTHQPQMSHSIPDWQAL